MTDGFRKLKNKCLTAAIVKSVIAGVSAGLILSGALMLAFGLSDIAFHWAYYILIGVLSAAAVGVAAFLIMRPTDKKVAKKYDERLNLNEKLQTMVEFSGKEGDIIAIQREDASHKLNAAKIKTFEISKLWYYLLIAVLALAMFFTGVFVPAAAQSGTGPDGPETPVDPGPDEDFFEYDLFMQAGVAELITNVRESSLSAALKEEFVRELTSLDTNLAEIDSKQQMRISVTATVTAIDALVTNANTFRIIGEVFGDKTSGFGAAIFQSAAVYISSPNIFNDYNRVKAFETKIGENIEIVLQTNLTPILEAVRIPQNGVTDEETGETATMAERVNSLVASLEKALAAEVDETDALYVTLDTLLQTFRGIADDIGKYKDETLYTRMDKAFTELDNAMNTAMSAQCYNLVMNNFVRTRLASIFGLDVASLPEFNEDLNDGNNSGGNTGDPGDKDPDDDGNGGGGGNQDELYGSDDMIYDPDLGEYVKYGDVLAKYYERVYDRILDGSLSGELSEIIEEYFKILYGGIENDETDEK